MKQFGCETIGVTSDVTFLAKYVLNITFLVKQGI